MDEVIRRFLAELDSLQPEREPQMLAAQIRALVSDDDYWHYQVTRANGSSFAVHRPETGVQVHLARRCNGTMSYVHSHSVWLALAPIFGIETHRRYDVETVDHDHARLTLAEERQLRAEAGDVVTLTPPHDVHSHGHVQGSGDCPYTVIVLGDNQLRYEREEFDLASGMRRPLHPGDAGTINLPTPQSLH